MPYVMIQTRRGMVQVRVCEHCRAVPTRTKFCSGRCARQWRERQKREAK